MSAGDGQEAAPGTPVATQPAVVVRSAAGGRVPNVTVSFAIDSGGGSVAATSATTNASGVASPGAWTLGPAEGPQVLVATVAGLTPLRIRAQARIPTTEVGSGTISPGGGATITVNRPGSPLDGASLSVPAGAVTGPAPVTLSIVSSTGLALANGLAATSPGLVITAPVAALLRPARVRVPTSAPPGATTLLVAYNQRTGIAAPLARQVPDPGGITALLPSLDASVVPSSVGTAPNPAGASPLSTSEGADDPLTLLVLQLPPEAFTRTYAPLFLPQRDNWDFDDFPVAWLPFLDPDPPTPTASFDMSTGMIATALWYFGRGEPPLYRRFRLQADWQYSNRSGIRWAALAAVQAKQYVAGILGGTEDQRFDAETAAGFNWNSLRATKGMFYLFNGQPVPLVLFNTGTLEELDEADALRPADRRYAIAIGSSGDELEIILPGDREATHLLRVSEQGGLEPLTLPGGDFVVRSFQPMLARPLMDQPAVAGNWPKVLAETVGDAEGWPTPTLRWKEGDLDPGNVVLADPLRHYWQCGDCPDYGIRSPGAPAEAVKPAPFSFGRAVGGAIPTLTQVDAVTWSADSVDSETAPTRAGNAIYLAHGQLGAALNVGWLDWQTVSYRRIGLRPAPAEVTFAEQTTVTFTLDPTQPLPSGTTFSWVFVSDAGRDSVVTTVPTYAREFELGQTGDLLIIAHEKDTRRPIARETVPVEYDGGSPFWRITSIVDEDELLDPGVTVPFQVLLARLLAVPTSGLIAVDDEGGGKKVLRLRVLPGSTWNPSECCPPPTPLGGELRQTLGEQPTITYQVGPFFAGFGTTEWSQSTGDIGAGTLFGQYVAGGTAPRKIKDAGTQTGPVDFIRISATRNGTTMTGTITVYAWFQNEETGEVDPEFEPSSYVLSFTAVRLQ